MFERTKLADGPRVISARLHDSRSVSVAAYVLAGSRVEAEGQVGVAHFLEHLTFKGTNAYPSTRSLSEAIEGVGGSFNAATDRESTVYWARVPRREATRAVDVLGELICRPALDEAEIDRERSVIVEEIRGYLDDPVEYCQILFQQAMFGRGRSDARSAARRRTSGPGAPSRSASSGPPATGRRTPSSPSPATSATRRRSGSWSGRSDAETASPADIRSRRSCRPGTACSSGVAPRPRPSSASASRRSAAIIPTRGPCPSSTPSSATG